MASKILLWRDYSFVDIDKTVADGVEINLPEVNMDTSYIMLRFHNHPIPVYQANHLVMSWEHATMCTEKTLKTTMDIGDTMVCRGVDTYCTGK